MQALRKIRTAAPALDALPEQGGGPPAGAEAAGKRMAHGGIEPGMRVSGEQDCGRAPRMGAASKRLADGGTERGDPGCSPPSPPVMVPETPLSISFLGQARCPPARA